MGDRTPRAPALPDPRALGTTGTPGTPGTAVFAECPDNDDERERRERRRSRVVEAALQNFGSPEPRSESWQSSLPQWTNEQVSEHYRTCIKLCAENKITTKNAFGLHLIDYMPKILKQNSDFTNFQVAAGTLDASAKIYAMRVDSLYADTYKILENLGKISAPAKHPERPEEGSSPAPTARKAQPKKKQTFKTIETDLSKINAPEGSRKSKVDPMFKRSLASFNESSMVGYFMLRLRSQNFQNQLLFPSEIIPLPSSDTPALPSTDPIRVDDLKAILTKCAEKRPICSSLAGFRFNNWDEESHDKSVSALLEKFQRSKYVFDPNTELDSEDEKGAAATEFQLESPGAVAGEEIGEFSENLDQTTRTDRAPLGEGDIRTMSQHLSMNPGEYSYFSPRTLSMWAGPEHWRFQHCHKPDAVSEKKSRRRNPRKPFELNFDEDIDFKPYFHQTKEPTTMAKSTLKRQNVRNTTLPEDFHYDPENLRQLFLKPTVKISRNLEPVETLEAEAGVGDYDYNHPNDTCNFCPAPQDPDSDDDPDPVEFQGEAEEFNLTAQAEAAECTGIGRVVSGGDITTYGELSLIAEPQKINRITIPYAKTAKKMDMSRLKKEMWMLLTEEEGGEAAGPEAGPDTAVVAGEKLLSDIIKKLLRRLPPVMATNLSVPLAFMCLLHLANEKNLNLESTADLSDVVVKQGD